MSKISIGDKYIGVVSGREAYILYAGGYIVYKHEGSSVEHVDTKGNFLNRYRPYVLELGRGDIFKKVRLSDGSVGEVIGITKEEDRPIMVQYGNKYIWVNKDGSSMPDYPYVVSLIKEDT